MNRLAVLAVLVANVCSQGNNTRDIYEPVTFTISPKIWSLLETKAGLITNTVKSIRFPDKEQMVNILYKYAVWGGHFDGFSIPKAGVSFENMNNGVHLRMKNIQFSGSIQARLLIIGGLARASGAVLVRSSNAELNIVLVWNDFSFTPTVTLNSNFRVDFTHHLRFFNFLRGHVQKLAMGAANKEVPAKLAELIVKEVNPRLQKLKQKLLARGLTEYDIEWTVQNQILRVGIKTKGANNVITPVKPIDKMVCIDVNVAKLAPKAKRCVLSSNIDVTCLNPLAKCEGLSCSFCTDIDINPVHPNAHTGNFHNCTNAF